MQAHAPIKTIMPLPADVPEVRIIQAVPAVVETVIRLCSRLLDASMDAVFPLRGQALDLVLEAQAAAIPPEYARAIAKLEEGKIKNDDQWSSEVHEASYEFYRRRLREQIGGFKGETAEDFTARQLGLTAPGASAEVLSRHLDLNPHLDPDTEMLADIAAAGEPGPASVRDQLHAAVSQRLQHQVSTLSGVAAQEAEVAGLRSRVRSRAKQSTVTIANAGLGIGLSFMIFKGARMAVKKIIKEVKRARKLATAGGRPASPVARPSRAAAAQQPTPTARAAQQKQQKAAPAAQSKQQPAATQQQQQQQQQQAQQATEPTTTRRARTATRTR